MVVRIRLARWGVKNNPFYGIVVTNSRSARDGRHLERVGTYNPIPDERGTKHIELNVNRIKYWLSVGADMSDRVAWLLNKAGIVPLPPKLLQRTTPILLNNPSTWSVEVKDANNGETLTVLSSQEAQLSDYVKEQLGHVWEEPKDPVLSKVSSKFLELDGRIPKEVLTDGEKLKVLREFSGIH